MRTLDINENDVLQRMQAVRKARRPPQYMLRVYRKYSALSDGVQRTIVAFFDRGKLRVARFLSRRAKFVLLSCFLEVPTCRAVMSLNRG